MDTSTRVLRLEEVNSANDEAKSVNGEYLYEEDSTADETYSTMKKQVERLDSVTHTVKGGSSFGFEFPEEFGDFQPSVVGIVGIVSLVIALLAFVFLIQKKKAPRGRFLKWLREFLNFRSIVISGIIKFLYAFLATFLTIISIVVMFQGKDDSVLTMIIAGLLIMIVGNVLLRVVMEMSMALIVVWGNTSDIRRVMMKDEEEPEERNLREPKVPKESNGSDTKNESKRQEEPEAKLIAEEVVTEQQVEVEPVANSTAQPAVQSTGSQPGTTQPNNVQPGNTATNI